MTRRAAAGLAACLAVGACSERKAAPAGAHIGAAIAAALTAAEAAREPWRCADPDAPDERIAIGGHTWRIHGHVLALDAETDASVAGGHARGGNAALAIGAIADAAGSAPATLAALGRLRGRLEQVDLVVSLGGMGATTAELDAVFAALADRAPWPLIVLPGDLEPVPAQIAAIAAARRRGTAVIDGRLVQRIELPGATIALVPGAGAVGRLAAGADGCRYRPEDAIAAFAELTPRPGLRVMASAEPPRTAEGDVPTGERAVTAGAGQEVDLALYGPTRGAATAACSGGRDGAAIAVTPGSSDATARLPDPRRTASAGVLTMHGTAWTWQPIDDFDSPPAPRVR